MSLADELLADLDDAEAAEEVMCDVTGRELEDFTMALVSNDSTTNDPLLEKSSVFTGTTAFSDAPVTAYAKLRNTDRVSLISECILLAYCLLYPCHSWHCSSREGGGFNHEKFSPRTSVT